MRGFWLPARWRAPAAPLGLRPVPTARRTVESTERQPASDTAKATILIGDDDPSLRELIRAVLGSALPVRRGRRRAEVLAVARDLRPDLIVLDVMMPGLSGIEVLDQLRSDAELTTTPVVVITAWSHAEVDAWTAGADRFVSKPFDPDDLSTAVEELLA